MKKLIKVKHDIARYIKCKSCGQLQDQVFVDFYKDSKTNEVVCAHCLPDVVVEIMREERMLIYFTTLNSYCDYCAKIINEPDTIYQVALFTHAINDDQVTYFCSPKCLLAFHREWIVEE